MSSVQERADYIECVDNGDWCRFQITGDRYAVILICPFCGQMSIVPDLHIKNIEPLELDPPLGCQFCREVFSVKDGKLVHGSN